jgi:signal transduction histidine kinase
VKRLNPATLLRFFHIAPLWCGMVWLVMLGDLCGNDLSSVSAVRALSTDRAAQGIEVEVICTVLYAGSDGAVVTDHSEGIWVPQLRRVTKQPLRRGQRWRIKGVTEPGNFAPQIRPAEAFLVEPSAPMLDPLELTYQLLRSSHMDCQWATTSGLVLSHTETTTRQRQVVLKVATSAGEITVVARREVSLPNCVGCIVKIKGVTLARYDTRRRFAGLVLRVSEPDDLLIFTSAPKGESLPLTSLSEIRGFRSKPSLPALVKVTAAVSAVLTPGVVAITCEGEHGLVSGEGPEVRSGDEVSIEGYSQVDDVFVLSSASWQPTGQTRQMQPLPLSSPVGVELHQNALVVTRGTVISASSDPQLPLLDLAVGDMVAKVRLPLGAERSAIRWPCFQPGDSIEVTGIAHLETVIEPFQTASQALRVTETYLWPSAPSDAKLIRAAPPTDAEKQILVSRVMLGLLSALLVVLGYSGWRRRRDARLQAEQYKLISTERDRLARQLHDTLAQGLSTVSIRLDAAKARLNLQPDLAHNHLDFAKEQVQQSLTEVRHAIQDLRPQLLEQHGLEIALQRVALRLAPESKPTIILNVELSSAISEALQTAIFFIAQEALSNAVHHSGASLIQLHLYETKKCLRLEIEDDGHGFHYSAGERGSPGHLGLSAMKQRAECCGGSFEVQSSPKGTTILSAFTSFAIS